MLIINKFIGCNQSYIKQKGSVLILTVTIIAIISSISLVTLNIALSHYELKKSNSNIRRALYMSEDGINSSILKIYNLVSEACLDSENKADDYMELYPEDNYGANYLFKDNYKLYLINKIANRINSNENPSIEIINYNKIFFENEKMSIVIKSKYISVTGIEKSLTAELIILIPNYFDLKSGNQNYDDLFYLNDFVVQQTGAI